MLLLTRIQIKILKLNTVDIANVLYNVTLSSYPQWFPLANKKEVFCLWRESVSGLSCPGEANNGGSKLTSPISPGHSPRQRRLFGLFHPLLPASFFIVFGCTNPRGLLSYRNYKRSQLKLMSLNSLAPRFDCISKAIRDTIALTAISSLRKLCALLNALLNKD